MKKIQEDRGKIAKRIYFNDDAASFAPPREKRRQ